MTGEHRMDRLAGLLYLIVIVTGTLPGYWACC